jgi:radical SAM superfamily enzyme YgiQ (UPF0313 family)
MRILLVKPDWNAAAGHIRYGYGIRFPALSLGILATLSPGHDVRIVDEGWEPIPYDDPFDLVGITTTTFTSEAAYAIAARFRSRGIPVVMGGVHASILPEECARHVDAVVIGEGEYTWPRILRDAEAKRLKKVYRAPRPTDMKDVPLIRRELLQEDDWFTTIEASRGCPNKCRYCYLPSVPWRAHRARPIETVVQEVRSLRQQTFSFADENLFANRDNAVALFRALAPLGKSWLLQVPTTVADDDELLDAMAEGGCFNAQIGFQSFNDRALEFADVGHNRIAKYETLIRKLHDRRIIVTGFFVFGFDSDDAGVFDSTVRMIRRMDLDDVCLFINTPFPGTSFYEQYEREGRILPGKNRSQFAFSHATFQPKLMTARELEDGVQRAYDQLYPHFVLQMFKIARTHWPLALRNPRLAAAMVSGNFRRPHLAGRDGSLLDPAWLVPFAGRVVREVRGRVFGNGG